MPKSSSGPIASVRLGLTAFSPALGDILFSILTHHSPQLYVYTLKLRCEVAPRRKLGPCCDLIVLYSIMPGPVSVIILYNSDSMYGSTPDLVRLLTRSRPKPNTSSHHLFSFEESKGIIKTPEIINRLGHLGLSQKSLTACITSCECVMTKS